MLAGVLLSLAFIGLFGLGFGFLYGQATQEVARRGPADQLTLVFFGTLLTTFGLYAVHFLSSFVALFLSVGAISGEIDSGTLHAVLARPIRRAEFVLGRWLGQVAIICVYVAVMASALLLIARAIAGYEAPDAVRAIGLMMLGSVLLLTISLLGSTLLSTLANGMVAFTLFGLAWLAGIIESIGEALANSTMVNLGVAVSLLVPSDGLWRAASYHVQSSAFLAVAAGRGGLPFASATPPAGPFLVWGALYIVVCLGAAVLAFSRRDL